jgi:hypothetical protein
MFIDCVKYAELFSTGCFKASVHSNASDIQFQAGLLARNGTFLSVAPFSKCNGTCNVIVPWNVYNGALLQVANLQKQNFNATLSYQTFPNTSTGECC